MLPLRDNVRTRTFPLLTLVLIGTNLAVWVLYQLPDLQGSVNELAYHPCEVERSCPVVGADWPLTVLTSMFLHGGWEHVLGNMLFLWIFGNNVEDALGPLRFLGFYLLGGVAATALQTFVTLGFGTQADGEIPNVGASGAVSAVLGAYLLLLPTARVLTLVFFFLLYEIPAFAYLGLWFLFQLWSGGVELLHPSAGGGVAFFAHVGGFAFGFVAVKLFQVRDPRRGR